MAPDLGAERWLELMEVDKKNEGGEIRFILLEAAGRADASSGVPQRAAARNACRLRAPDMDPDQHLAPYAAHSAHGARAPPSPETAHASRSEFQRDRDRIIHCTAFRRLDYKTQVFLNHEGDLFRTRLTH